MNNLAVGASGPPPRWATMYLRIVALLVIGGNAALVSHGIALAGHHPAYWPAVVVNITATVTLATLASKGILS